MAASEARPAGAAWRARWAQAVERETPRLIYWAPAAIGLGVWSRLAAPFAPPSGWSAAVALLTAAALAWAAWGAPWRRAALLAVALAALGVLAAELRLAMVEAPVWPPSGVERGFRFRAVAVEGRVRAVDVAAPESQEGKAEDKAEDEKGDKADDLADGAGGQARLLLDQVAVAGAPPAQTPRRVRVTVSARALERAAREAGLDPDAPIGARASFTARLWPPPGPSEPGAFDFRRYAWFQSLGALGRVEGAPRLAPAAPAGALERLSFGLERLRARLAARARAAAPGREGAIVAALLVGDRSGVDDAAAQALRDANLAHLLAISGLHMGLVCLTVFGLVRLLFALTPGGAGRFDPKKIAALAALAAGALYLALAGAGVPAQRAYLMAAVVFGAVLADRPAITLRAVALAACLILLWRPESLLQAGFQLSFAATTAMVAVFEATRGSWRALRRQERRGGPARRVAVALAGGALALVTASLTAGLATAPFAAFAFNRLSRYGLIANLAAVPAMGLWIMPWGVAALALAPFGLDAWAYRAMALGVGWVLTVAHWVAALPGAARAVAAGPDVALGLIALGGLWLCLWRGPALRLAGLAPVALGVALWLGAARPAVLIAPGGRLVGALTPSGRVVAPRREDSYAADQWRRRDGDAATAQDAAARPGFAQFEGGRMALLPSGWRLEILEDRRLSRARLAASCGAQVILLAPFATVEPPAGCVFYDRRALRRAGAIAIHVAPEGLRVLQSAQVDGGRPWSGTEAPR